MSLLKEKISSERLDEFFNEAYWFHTIELGNGRATEGVYDIRSIVDLHGFDDSLAGKSVLDVGSSDGFYSFEFARRGAESVLAIDNNPYDGTVQTDVSPAKQAVYEKKYAREGVEFKRFEDIYSSLELKGANKLVVLADYLDSIVQFQEQSVYELDRLGRTFDLVFCGGLIGHLKDPLRALEQLRTVTAGRCIITLNGALPLDKGVLPGARKLAARLMLRLLGMSEHFSENKQDLILQYIGNQAGGSFFQIHPATLREMLLASGFKSVDIIGDYEVVDRRINQPQRGCVFNCLV
ncbi:class I SAM-dependent methyltransferase [Thermodesulfobacteriota bacterium]